MTKNKSSNKTKAFKKVENALWNAVSEDNEDEIRHLIQGGIDVNAPLSATGKMPFTGETPLHFAATWGKKKVASALIKMKADVNATTANHSLPAFMDKGTPLHSAAISKMPNNEEMVEFLAKAKADVNCYDKNGDTPLHNAVHSNYADSHVKTVETLLAHKADPTLKDGYGMTPSELAYSDGETALGDLLAEAERQKKLDLKKSKDNLETTEIKTVTKISANTATSPSATSISAANNPNAFMSAPSTGTTASTPAKPDGQTEEKAKSITMTQSGLWIMLKMKHDKKQGAKNSEQKRKIKSEIMNQIIPQLVFDADAIESTDLTFQKALEILNIYEVELSPTQQTIPTFLTLKSELEKAAAYNTARNGNI